MTIPVLMSTVLSGVFLLHGVVLMLYPTLKGADALFGVPVDEAYYRGKQARRRVVGFRLLTVACTAVTVTGAWLLHLGAWGWVAMLGGVLGMTAGLAVGYSATRPHRVEPPTQAAAMLAPRDRWQYVRPGLEAAALLIVLGSVAYLAWVYSWAPLGLRPALGEATPIHQNALWLGQVLVLVEAQHLIVGLLSVMGIAQARASLPAPPSEHYLELRDRYTRLMADSLYLVRLTLMVAFAISLPLAIAGGLSESAATIVAAVLVPLVGANLVMFGSMLLYYWPNMSRLREQMQELAGPGSLERSADSDGWISGFMYYCPGNPSVWVEARMGYGYTLNFARAEAWGILAVICLPIVYLIATAP